MTRKAEVSSCELRICAKSISLCFKQVLYELCSIYGTEVTITCSGGSMQKNACFTIFAPRHHKNCKTRDDAILN
jgi:hypothetical protein